MKKILSVVSAMIICMSFAGCRKNDENTSTDDKRFITVSEEHWDFGSRLVVIADKETSICYVVYRDTHMGGITPLIDKDGKPVLYNK